MNPGMAESTAFSPLFVDFLGGGTAYRHARNCTIKQPLARAVGIRSGFRPDIFDATAGLGGDGFVLACLGCQVLLNERSPIVAALLEDGLRLAATDPRTAEITETRIRLVTGDSRENLKGLDHPPYTVYLDPMYPHSPKSALNKKAMRMIRDIVGDDTDGSELLETALAHAGNRVVVKRPKGAELLGGKTPSHQILMKNSRYDVYLILQSLLQNEDFRSKSGKL
jgi:16S rRNA (guanine1516-N2)-methyltransferase